MASCSHVLGHGQLVMLSLLESGQLFLSPEPAYQRPSLIVMALKPFCVFLPCLDHQVDFTVLLSGAASRDSLKIKCFLIFLDILNCNCIQNKVNR